jgi:DNA-binding transcriptional LysR family regulator
MAQPPLSKAIRQLETKLGVQLFERTTRHVSLTRAGQVLLDEGRPALDSVAAAGRRAQRAGQAGPQLVVTVKPGVAYDLVREILDTYHVVHPDLPVGDMVMSDGGEPAAMVRQGRADVAVLSTPFDDRGLETRPIFSERRLVVLPLTHRLAGRYDLTLADLAGEPTAGATGVEVNDITHVLEVVALGQAVAFVAASVARRHARPDLVFRPVGDLSPLTLVVAWAPGGTGGRSVTAFVEAAADVARRLDGRLMLLHEALA